MLNSKIRKLESNKAYHSSNKLAIKRLLSEYDEYGDLLIAFDFDSTLFDLYETGLNTRPIIDLVKKCQKLKLTTILWTAIVDEWSLTYKKRIVKDMGLNFTFYNESPVLNNSRKPHFSILLDDRAGLKSAFEVLSAVVKAIEVRNNATKSIYNEM